jgi:hypothetical protein
MDEMNQAIRSRGNRARSVVYNALLPDIGQNSDTASSAPSTSASLAPAATSPGQAMAEGTQTAAQIAAGATHNPFDIHPPGQPANPGHYNYEPRGDGAWIVYPPGVQAPDGSFTTSMPRAASTADYTRMSGALGQQMTSRRPGGY